MTRTRSADERSTLVDVHEDPAAKVAAALERVGTALRAHAQREAQQHGVTPTQMWLLLRLAAAPSGRRRPGALARELEISSASLSDSIAALERKGLVERRRVSEDRRGFSLSLTDDGARLARRRQAVAEPFKLAVASLPPEQQLALMGALYRLIAELQRTGLITVAQMCITCRYFRPDVHAGRQPHHCALLDALLAERSLRVDCPEHEQAA